MSVLESPMMWKDAVTEVNYFADEVVKNLTSFQTSLVSLSTLTGQLDSRIDILESSGTGGGGSSFSSVDAALLTYSSIVGVQISNTDITFEITEVSSGNVKGACTINTDGWYLVLVQGGGQVGTQMTNAPCPVIGVGGTAGDLSVNILKLTLNQSIPCQIGKGHGNAAIGTTIFGSYASVSCNTSANRWRGNTTYDFTKFGQADLPWLMTVEKSNAVSSGQLIIRGRHGNQGHITDSGPVFGGKGATTIFGNSADPSLVYMPIPTTGSQNLSGTVNGYGCGGSTGVGGPGRTITPQNGGDGCIWIRRIG